MVCTEKSDKERLLAEVVKISNTRPRCCLGRQIRTRKGGRKEGGR